jgi:hypothetical protein
VRLHRELVETKDQQVLVETKVRPHQRDQKVSRVPRVQKVIKDLRVHPQRDQKDHRVIHHKVTLVVVEILDHKDLKEIQLKVE